MLFFGYGIGKLEKHDFIGRALPGAQLNMLMKLFNEKGAVSTHLKIEMLNSKDSILTWILGIYYYYFFRFYLFI